VRGETVAVDGSKFRAVSSAKSVREREATKRYLEQLDAADEQEEVGIDQSAVQVALKKLKNDPEPEIRLMPVAQRLAPAYNVQTAVDVKRSDRGAQSHRSSWR
jgi:chromosomal replication initiation ATPase DnaA